MLAFGTFHDARRVGCRFLVLKRMGNRDSLVFGKPALYRVDATECIPRDQQFRRARTESTFPALVADVPDHDTRQVLCANAFGAERYSINLNRAWRNH